MIDEGVTAPEQLEGVTAPEQLSRP
jgi:hypothetical protein